MKFPLAIWMLGQTVPTVVSQKISGSASASVGVGDDVKTFMVQQSEKEKEQFKWNYPSKVRLYQKRRGLLYPPTKRQLESQSTNGLLKKNILPKNSLRKKNHHHLLRQVACNPNSIDPDTGILSCGKDYFCQPTTLDSQSLGGICTPSTLKLPSKMKEQYYERRQNTFQSNLMMMKKMKQGKIRHTIQKKKKMMMMMMTPSLLECNPNTTTTTTTTVDVDIGILACENGYICKSDESSKLGGFCIPVSTASITASRHLYTFDDFSDLCGPGADEYYTVCDCSNVNMTTGTGTMNCFNDVATVYGCDDVVVNNTYSITMDNFSVTQGQDCYVIQGAYDQKSCFTTYGEYLNQSCVMEWNGQRCTSCAKGEYIYDFDCSNIGGPTGTSLLNLSSAFDECYIEPSYTCTDLCGEGNYIPETNYILNVTLPEYGDYSCRDLAYSAEYYAIQDMYCPFFSSIAKLGCCAPYNPIEIPTYAPEQQTDDNSVPGLSPTTKPDDVTNTPASVPREEEPVIILPGIEEIPVPPTTTSTESTEKTGSSTATLISIQSFVSVLCLAGTTILFFS